MAESSAATHASGTKPDSLANADWETITLRLVRYALFKVRRLEWRTGSFLPKGMMPEDIALEAIRKTFEGSAAGPRRGLKKGLRVWDPERYPDLLDFLKSVVDSDVHALVESSEHRLTNYSPDRTPAEAAESLGQQLAASGAVSADAEAATLAASEDEKLLHDALVGWLRQDLRDDQDASWVLSAYERLAESEVRIKPARVAELTGLDEKRVRNAIRRIERRARQFNESHEEKRRYA